MTNSKENRTEKEKQSGGRTHSEAIMDKREQPMMFFDEIDRMLSSIRNELYAPGWDSFQGFMLPRSNSLEKLASIRRPLSNISSDKRNYYITTETPGLDKNDIEITIQDNILRIQGEAKETKKKEDEYFLQKETHSAKYYRSYVLPEQVVTDDIDASLDKGILTITIPKSQVSDSEEKTIKVN
ncbi:MAG: Hsp20/alpha crystallin family protein [Candidatus Thorarchaeota archaeon]